MRKNAVFLLIRPSCPHITAGRIKYGDVLPPAAWLSEQYNVGMRTVRNVLSALEKEGYIETEERKRAVVIYRENTSSHNVKAIYCLLERKRSVLEACETAGLLSSFFFLGSCFCSEEDFEEI